MKDNFSMIKDQGKVNTFLELEMFLMVIGQMIKKMDKEL